jgi:hypothetical protein
MPYIAQDQRQKIEDAVIALADEVESPGQLNFAITRLVLHYLTNVGSVSYTRIAELTGVLENVKQEFYRRVAAPYEDKKCAQHGDVYQELL